MGWEPLPDDVAEWMGLDTDMVPHAVEMADVDEPTPDEVEALDDPVSDEADVPVGSGPTAV